MFTKEQISEVRNLDIIKFLSTQGFEFEPNGSYMRCVEHDSLVVKDNGSWFWNSRSISGSSVIDFVMKASNMTFVEAIKLLRSDDFITCTSERKEKIKQPFVLPPRAHSYKRAFAYLNIKRGIDGEIISKLMQEHKIYETAKYHSCAFVGADANGVPKHVATWGTYSKGGRKPFKGEITSSDKTYGFLMIGKTDVVYVYESPIDAMSHATIAKMNGEDYENVHRISLCCTWDGALKRFLGCYEMDKVVFCLDNDTAGNTACEKYMKEYYEIGYDVERICPKAKDFNDDLIYKIENRNMQGDIDNER